MMDEYETVEELETLISDMHRSLNRMGRIGRESDRTQEARIDQFARQMLSAVDYLYTVQDGILEEIYWDVENALTNDRQYAAESVMYWQSKGQDLGDIAGRLETSVEVLTDLIDECQKFQKMLEDEE